EGTMPSPRRHAKTADRLATKAPDTVTKAPALAVGRGRSVDDAEQGFAPLLALDLLDLDLVLAARGRREHHGGRALRVAGGQVADDPLHDHLAGGGLDLE